MLANHRPDMNEDMNEEALETVKVLISQLTGLPGASMSPNHPRLVALRQATAAQIAAQLGAKATDQEVQACHKALFTGDGALRCPGARDAVGQGGMSVGNLLQGGHKTMPHASNLIIAHMSIYGNNH